MVGWGGGGLVVLLGLATGTVLVAVLVAVVVAVVVVASGCCLNVCC